MIQPILVSTENDARPVDREIVTKSNLFVDLLTHEYGVMQRACVPEGGHNVFVIPLTTKREEEPHDFVYLHFDKEVLFNYLDSQIVRDMMRNIIHIASANRTAAWTWFSAFADTFGGVPHLKPELGGVWEVAFFNSCITTPLKGGSVSRLWIHLRSGHYGVDQFNGIQTQLHANMPPEELIFTYYLAGNYDQNSLTDYLRSDKCKQYVQTILHGMEKAFENKEISIFLFDDGEEALAHIIEDIGNLSLKSNTRMYCDHILWRIGEFTTDKMLRDYAAPIQAQADECGDTLVVPVYDYLHIVRDGKCG